MYQMCSLACTYSSTVTSAKPPMPDCVKCKDSTTKILMLFLITCLKASHISVCKCTVKSWKGTHIHIHTHYTGETLQSVHFFSKLMTLDSRSCCSLRNKPVLYHDLNGIRLSSQTCRHNCLHFRLAHRARRLFECVSARLDSTNT